MATEPRTLLGQCVGDGDDACGHMVERRAGGVVELVLVVWPGYVADSVRVSIRELEAVGVTGGTSTPPKCIRDVYRPINVVS